MRIETDVNEIPRVTFILITYNQEKYIAEAVASALGQDYQPLEIILSDDCSSDETFSIMERLASEYSGPNKIILNKNCKNLGLAGHLNKVMGLASGDLIVLSAGDDLSAAGRTADSVKWLSSQPDVSLISTSMIEFFDDGRAERVANGRDVIQIFPDAYFLRRGPHPPGCSRAFRREVYDMFGPLDPACPTEDTPMLVRGLIAGRVLIVPEIGVRYRRHLAGVSQGGQLNNIVESIRRQFLSDIEIALSRGFMTPDEHRNWVNRILSYTMNREYLYFAIKGDLNAWLLVNYLLFSGRTVRDRISLLKAWVKGKQRQIRRKTKVS